MKRLLIDRQAVVNNLETIRQKAGKAKIYAVLTGDACGAGLLEMAGLLHQHGVTRFAVSEPSDAAKLRKSGLVEEEILMLRSTTDREELEQLVEELAEANDIRTESEGIRDRVLPQMDRLRRACDEAETITAKRYWPFPTYGDLLFGVR